ncbi:MAG: hypothetical protein FJW95_16195 [Actinobacteria bacterium]|nr:hypothetical protein [Actinomycetota bacterium]
MRFSPEARAALRRIRRELATTGPALLGSVEVRRMRCGKAACACRATPPRLHGPYNVWTRKVAGRTVTRVLTDEELAAYQPLLDNARRLRSLVAELCALTLGAVPPEDHHRSGRRRSASP